MGFWSKVKSAFKAVAKVALVVVSIVMPALLPEIGAALLPAGATAAATTAAGAATIATASSLAQGNSIEVALKQGAVAGITAGVGVSTATSLQSAPAGAAIGSAAGTAVAGGNVQDVLRNAVAGGIGAGVGETTDSTALGKGAGTLVASGGNINAAINSAVGTELTSLASQGVAPYVASAKDTLKDLTAPTTTPEQQAAADAQKLVDTSKAQPGTQLAQADTGTATDAGGALSTVNVTAPKYQAGAPENVLPYTTTDITRPSGSNAPTAGTMSTVTVTAPKYEAGAPENVLPYTSTDVAGTTTPTSDKQPLAQKPADSTSEKVIKPSLYFTGVAPTGGALAQGLGTSFSGVPTTGTSVGLTGERGAGEIESKESGKARQNVWNEASLRLKDALGV
jgi:hypothetical protein